MFDSDVILLILVIIGGAIVHLLFWEMMEMKKLLLPKRIQMRKRSPVQSDRGA